MYSVTIRGGNRLPFNAYQNNHVALDMARNNAYDTEQFQLFRVVWCMQFAISRYVLCSAVMCVASCDVVMP